MVFQDMLLAEENLDKGAPTGDFRSSVFAAQLSNIRNYLGYQLITQLGFSVDRRSVERFEEDRKSRNSSFTFITVYASLKE